GQRDAIACYSPERSTMLDGVLKKMDAHLDNFDTLVEPAPESNPRTPFETEDTPKSSLITKTTLAQKVKFFSRGIPLFWNMQKSAGLYDGNFTPTKSEASPEFIAELEQLAREAGAQDIAYVKVPRPTPQK
ncbi:MAG: hypothetical protein AAF311_06085, partial [Pseudomonadota bacterium]